MRTARTRARCVAAAPSRSRVCAAGFAWGYPGTHECPPWYYTITTADACALAANITGKTYRGKADFGPGCFLDFRDGYIYSSKGMFRDDANYAQPLCSGLLASRAASAAHALHGAVRMSGGCYSIACARCGRGLHYIHASGLTCAGECACTGESVCARMCSMSVSAYVCTLLSLRARAALRVRA